MITLSLTNENFNEEVLKSDVPVLVDFYADWCGPCKMVAPIIEEIASEFDDIKVLKLNIDEAGDIASQFSVMSIPTIMFFKNGEVDKKLVGFRSKEALIDELGL